MKSENQQFRSSIDKLPIHYYKWYPTATASIKGAIQIAHGLSEHAKRYASFARVLTDQGYVVYANDHRGHGQTAGSPEKVGYLEDAPFWASALRDMYQLNQIIQKEQAGVPVFLFGHSMGSLLARQYITQWGQTLRGVIISATGGDPGMLGKIGALVAKVTAMINGKKKRSQLMDKLSFGKFNDAFKPNRTAFDWLSRDEKEVDKYIADPYCGVVFSAGFWEDFLKGINYINSAEAYQKTPKTLPILLIAGDKDPVGDMAKGVLQIKQAYKQVAIQNLQCKIYPEARHELLNESNRMEIIQDILQWLEGR